MDTKEELTGAVDVNGKVTPTLREPIGQIDSSLWATMTLTELHDQRNMLTNRIDRVQTMGRMDLANQMKSSINALDALIMSKSTDEVTLI